jgi:hypothetical protein
VRAPQVALIARVLPDPATCSHGERAMLPALIRWLVSTGRLRHQTIVAHEVPWLGRRVDLALLTTRGIATAFELKVGRPQRVLEQAVYNSSSFHRSWVVTPNRPKDNGLAWAHQFGVGVLVVDSGDVRVSILPHLGTPDARVTARLRAAIRSKRVEAQ